jgi:uncharacterized protein (TIGR02266 family)
MQERRADQRVEVELDVNYRTVQEFVTAYSRNISGGGVFVRTPQPQPLNQKVLIRFTLPGIDRKFEIHGIVVWASSASSRSSFPAGMGIKFLELKPEEQQILLDFVNKGRTTGGAKPASGPGQST